MTVREEEFLSNIKYSIGNYNCRIESHYETMWDGKYFTVLIWLNDEEWCDYHKRVWDSLDEVARSEGANMDDEGNHCIGLSIKVED